MKILHVINIGYPAGGAEANVLALRDELRKRGHEARVLSSDLYGIGMFSDYTCKRIPEDSRWKFFQYLFYLRAYRAARGAMEDFQPDIIHFHTIGLFSPSILQSVGRIPAIQTIHGPEPFITDLLPWCLPASAYRGGSYEPRDLTMNGRLRYLYSRFLQGPLYRIGHRRIRSFVAPSTYISRIIGRDVPASKIVMLHNGMPLFSRAPSGPDSLAHTLAYAGRLERFKGVDYLIRAMPAILREFPDSKLLIVGDGAERPALEALAGELSVGEKITFFGHVPREQLESIYRQASVAVMPSTWPEAFGLSGVEAMSVGLPVIASDVGGISDWLIDGETGYLVPKKDSRALADSVIRLFSDPALLMRMGIAARTKAEQFDTAEHVDRLLDAYRVTIGLSV